MISIICPVLNEERQLAHMADHLHGLSDRAELIFVDGGSADASVDIAGRLGKVFLSRKGRAAQMNYGARYAQGNILLFLHADSCMYASALDSIEKKISDGYVGGCLTQRIDHDAHIYRFIEAQGNWRARTRKIFYGDQAIFVRKDLFWNIGGFPELPIMEDVLFTRKLRTFGKTALLPDPIIVSARRWEQKGIVKTMLLYGRIVLLYWLRAPLDGIKNLYEDVR